MFAQGQTVPPTAVACAWDDVQFEFNSTVPIDEPNQLTQIGEILGQHPDYRVVLVGHADIIGGNQANFRLALTRAEKIRDLLIKQGARLEQVSLTSQGVSGGFPGQSSVMTRTDEARWLSRRVTVTTFDGNGAPVDRCQFLQGPLQKSLEDAKKELEKAKEQVRAAEEKIRQLQEAARQQPPQRDMSKELAAVQDDQKKLQKGLDDLSRQVAAIPAPPTPAEIAKAMPKPDPKFTLLNVSLGLDMTRNLTASGSARYFAPFGGNFAVQGGADYSYFHGQQEGQGDLGLVGRSGNTQLGLFASFKRVQFDTGGGTLGQASITLDRLFSRGRFGAYGTKSFLDGAVVNRIMLGSSGNVWNENFLRVTDQFGGSAQIALFGNSYAEGNLGVMFRQSGINRPGGRLRFVQPLDSRWALTVEGGLNESFIGKDRGRIAVGVQFGNWVRPRDFKGLNHAVPVSVPRIGYELLTRVARTGNAPPVADAGPNQIGISAGPVALDGSGSYDPDGDAITFEWLQIAGPTVSVTGVHTAKASFTAAEGQSYSFRLTVKDSLGAIGTDTVTVSVKVPVVTSPPVIKNFAVNPASITAGQSSTLLWQVTGADTVSITGLGNVTASGSKAVSPAATTAYVITAINAQGQVTQTVTLTVTAAVTLPTPLPVINNFVVNPASIAPGQSSTLLWQVAGADTISITGLGNVAASGSKAVSPAATTTYVLTASNAQGQVTQSATLTVTAVVTPPVPSASLPVIANFVVNPASITAGQSSTLLWQVAGADTISITGLGNVTASGSRAVSPAATTTYVLTASNAQGQVTQSATLTVTAAVTPPVPPGLLNNPPVAIAGADFVTRSPYITLDGSGSYDPDGDPITFEWTGIPATTAPGAYFGSPTAPASSETAKTSAILGAAGRYTFMLTVRDSKGAIATSVVHVTYAP
jgi:flagellar motor protein MotB